MHDKKISVDVDAFSSGQVASKIWLCNEFTKLNLPQPLNIWIYGGWHGILSFLLLSRHTISINSIRSFDIDPQCQIVADTINENWVWQQWKFKAFTADCNLLNVLSNKYGPTPNCIINTSTEHMSNMQWFANLPNGMLVILQSNNMQHEDHHQGHGDLDEFDKSYHMVETKYIGQLDFDYNTWQFSRYMKIGIK